MRYAIHNKYFAADDGSSSGGGQSDAERAAEKLRQERQYCGQVSAFIKTSTFSKHEPYYSKVSSE